MNEIKIPFFHFQNDVEWHILKAIEHSLSLSEVAKKTGVSIYNVSRIISRIKSGNGISVSFEPDLKKCGIIEVAAISTRLHETLPYLRAVRTLRTLGKKLFLYTAMVPLKDDAIMEWFSHFKESSITVRDLEHVWWRTNASATIYEDKKLYGDIGILKIANNTPPRLPFKEISIDEIDILLIWAKIRWPFSSLREIERESEKYLGYKVSHQTLSRHFKEHILKLWINNRVRLYSDTEQVPYRILYLEGHDAPGVARALVQLPWFHTAYIDFDKALVSGQPPCQSMPHLYKVLGDLDVEAYDFVMELSLLKGVPLFNLLTQLVKVEKEVSPR